MRIKRWREEGDREGKGMEKELECYVLCQLRARSVNSVHASTDSFLKRIVVEYVPNKR